MTDDPHLFDREHPQTPGNPFGLALHGNAEEEFPVLKAFESYIEAERQKSRKRMIMLSACFVGAILVIVAIFLAIGSILFTRIFDQQDRMQDRLAQTQDRLLAAMIERQTAPQPVAVQPAPQPLVQPAPQPVVQQPAPQPAPTPVILAAAVLPQLMEQLPVVVPPPAVAPTPPVAVVKPLVKPLPPPPALKPAPQPIAGATPPAPPTGFAAVQMPVRGRSADTIAWRALLPE